jgi:hypothetical protein
MAPRAVVTDPLSGTRPNWLLMWHGGDATKRNIFYSQSTTPENPTTWSAEKVLVTSPSLASVGDPSPSFDPVTRTTWLFYTGFSQRLGRSDVYLTKYNSKTLGDANQFFGLMGFAPVTADVLTANSSRTVYTSGGIDWNIDAAHPVQVYLDDVPLLTPGDVGTRAANGEIVFEPRGTPNLAALRDPANNVRVIIDPSSGIVRFNMDTRRMRTLIAGLTPVGPAPHPDPEISADYSPQTLRITRSDAGSSGPVGLITTTEEPSWLGEVRDLQAQLSPSRRAESRPVVSRGHRLWVFWRRSAGPIGGGPALYYKTLRPAIKVQRGRFIDLNITLTPRLDLARGTATGSARALVPEDIDMAEGALYFGAESEGLVGSYGVPVPVDVTYRDPLTGSAKTETHFITWREEIGETPVPLDLSVNEGSLSVFPVYEKVQMQVSPQAAPMPVLANHLQKLWLFWSSTRGSGNDIFQATLAPRFKPDAQLIDPNFGLTLIPGRR